jgi:hypothetical protein
VKTENNHEASEDMEIDSPEGDKAISADEAGQDTSSLR